MNEHSFKNMLMSDAKKHPDIVHIKKLHGSGFTSGYPDIVYACYAGNFLIELKYVDPPKRPTTSYDPFTFCTPLQRSHLRPLWNLNGMAAVGIGMKIGGYYYFNIFEPEEGYEWFPRRVLPTTITRKRGECWDFERINERLADLVQIRFGLKKK